MPRQPTPVERLAASPSGPVPSSLQQPGHPMRRYLHDKHFVARVSLVLYAIVSVWCALNDELHFTALFVALGVLTVVQMRRFEHE